MLLSGCTNSTYIVKDHEGIVLTVKSTNCKYDKGTLIFDNAIYTGEWYIMEGEGKTEGFIPFQEVE